jgi:hypothetical protein
MNKALKQHARNFQYLKPGISITVATDDLVSHIKSRKNTPKFWRKHAIWYLKCILLLS